MPIDRRRRVVAAGIVGAFAAGASRGANAALPKVGYLSTGERDVSGAFQAPFVAGLREFGLIDGLTVEIVWRFTGGKPDRLAALAAELVAQRVSVIVAPHMDGLKAAAEATKTIPVVMCLGLDPVGLGLVRSLRRPGTNVTGTVWEQDPELTAKYLELLVEAVPGLTRVGCLIDPRWPGILRYKEVFDRAASIRRITVNTVSISSAEEIDRAMAALVAGGAQAAFVYGSNLSYTQLPRIVDAMVRQALPDIWLFTEAVQAGALMSYCSNLHALVRRAGYFVDRILRGADPAELSIEMPTQYELWVNRKRARALGLTLPASLLARVDRVIE